MKELQLILQDPIKGISIDPNDEDLGVWNASIEGPVDTPYEGGVFYMTIIFPNEFPFRPPKVKFVTKIFHPNINSEGSICIDILRDNWAASLTIQKVLLSIISLLNSPNPDDPLVPEIAKMFKENREKYIKTAKEWTFDFAPSP